MTNEEFLNTRQFILEQQAQFAADIQQLSEAQARTEQVVAQTGEIVGRLAYATHQGFTDVNAKINALVDSQIRTDESQIRTDDKIKALVESQLRTDEKINALVDSQLRTDERISVLVNSQKQTDQDLRN